MAAWQSNNNLDDYSSSFSLKWNRLSHNNYAEHQITKPVNHNRSIKIDSIYNHQPTIFFPQKQGLKSLATFNSITKKWLKNFQLDLVLAFLLHWLRLGIIILNDTYSFVEFEEIIAFSFWLMSTACYDHLGSYDGKKLQTLKQFWCKEISKRDIVESNDLFWASILTIVLIRDRRKNIAAIFFTMRMWHCYLSSCSLNKW